jgi:DNA-binding Lrp family transcriptional regulator
MAVVMKLDDEVRLNILAALLKPGAVVPNIRAIQKYTGYHKATVKSSLDFLAKQGLVVGYGPKADFRKLGYKLEVVSLLQLDLTKKSVLEKFVEQVRKDDNLYFLSGIIGHDNFNFISRHIYNDVDSYNTDIRKKYFESISGISDLFKAREIFYITDPLYKSDSRTESMIRAIRRSKGFD